MSKLSMSQALSSTQPLFNTLPPHPLLHNDNVWGWLIPLVDGMNHLPLDLAEVRAGRDPDECHVVLTSDIFQQSGVDLGVEKVSRFHFTLHHGLGENGSFLADNSLNGTWVNQVRIGKRNKIILDHCSVIAVLCQEMEMFCYLDMS